MKLFLALPVYGGYNAHFVTCLVNLLGAKRGYDIQVRPCIGDSLVARARNRLCAEFLASDCEAMLFLDTDLIFSPEHIAALVEHFQQGRQIVAGLYPKKQRELGWVCNILDGESSIGRKPVDSLVRVKYAGTGCLLIARGVLDTMRARLSNIEYDPDEGDSPGLKWDFFATGVRSFPEPIEAHGAETRTRLSIAKARRRYLSEDWMFCQRAIDLGFDIWMDTSVVLKHVGEFIYPVQDLETEAVSSAA